ncbi:PQQ-dependent sugar dehydrogenase [Nonomuraea sp. 10N515B]|uniref:PQQ-dependent sugar dehydrogenase n=1 Tax=Nonomuraea sp. 10N515B TaxID=3457422 RepID=UPI003FCDAE47
MRQHLSKALVPAVAVLLLAMGCSPSGASSSGAAIDAAGSGSGSGQVKVLRTVTEGLNSPWGLVTLPDGDLLVSSRDEATITRVDVDSGGKTELGEVPGVSAQGEGGLLGLALSPGFAADGLVYAYFTAASDNRIVRVRYDATRPEGKQLGRPDIVLRGIPQGGIHNGGHVEFGPDGMLYASTGESGDTPLAQDRNSLGGKILRMTPDGKPARGTPSPARSCTPWATATYRA